MIYDSAAFDAGHVELLRAGIVSSDLTRSDFVQFVLAARLGVVATASPSGAPEAALVDLGVSESAELLFETPVGARKLANIERNDRVAVVVGWNEGISIQIEGKVRIVSNDERLRYERIYVAQFPESQVSSPSFEVAVVTPDWVRRYDATVNPALCAHADWLVGFG